VESGVVRAATLKLQHGTARYRFNSVSEETAAFILKMEVTGSFETLVISARLHGITLQKTLLIDTAPILAAA
jgi:hypothetical protein